MSEENEYQLPKAAQEAADLAEELHAKMFAEETETPPSEEASSNTEQTPEESQVPPKEEVVVDDPNSETYKHKYEVLQGKYNKEVPSLAADLRELKAHIRELQTQKEQAPKEEPPQEENPFAAFEEQYSPEFVETLRKLARYEAQREAEKLLKPVAEKTLSVEETQIQTAQHNFTAYLDSKAEGWRDLWEGKDPGFIEFVQQPDPSGLYTYAQLLELYNNEWDADKMALVFNSYLQSKQQKQETPTTPNPVKEALIAPSRSTATAPPTSTEKKIWTHAEVDEFKVNDRKGKYSEEVSQAMWNDLLQAVNEGRIR